LRNLHQRQGVRFVSGAVQDVSPGLLRLDDGRALAADVVFNARPRVAPLEVVSEAGIAVDRGVLVDERLRTNVPDVSALGECARWPDPHTGARITVDHWAAAQRQAEVIARRLVGRDDSFDAAPFFRSRQYDVSLTFLGHAEAWDSVEVQGDLARFDATVTWRQGERLVAVVTLAREAGLRRAPWRRSGSHGAPGLE
jgi:NADPH-dependent 2,4-dienoyl-CoA reductase/sulfur reductase-like enzyme